MRYAYLACQERAEVYARRKSVERSESVAGLPVSLGETCSGGIGFPCGPESVGRIGYPAFIDDSFGTDEFWDLADEFDVKQAASRMEPDNQEKRAAYHEVEKRMVNYPAPSYKRVVDHIDHVVKLVGAQHVV